LERKALTVIEAAETVGVSRATVYRWLDNGTLSSVKLGGLRRILPEAIDNMLKEAA
jgi:excisionase family DNA binding protein